MLVENLLQQTFPALCFHGRNTGWAWWQSRQTARGPTQTDQKYACYFNVFIPVPAMKCLALFLAWCLLLVLCWPLALLALILFPLVWLVCLPFRIVGTVVTATLALVRAILFLPARLLGHR